MNWRGRPLTSHDVVINSIAATTTRTGLSVQADRDDGSYPTGVKVSNAQMAALPIGRHPFHGDWNYTLHPPRSTPQGRQPATSRNAAPRHCPS
jgi:Rhodopirellula transposase DDE domain